MTVTAQPPRTTRWYAAGKIKIALTILFLVRGGREIAPRLVGGSQSNFYGAYRDERLALAKTATSKP